MLHPPASRSARVRALLALHEADWPGFLTPLDKSPFKMFATEKGSSFADSPIKTFGTLHGIVVSHEDSFSSVFCTSWSKSFTFYTAEWHEDHNVVWSTVSTLLPFHHMLNQLSLLRVNRECPSSNLSGPLA